LPCKESTRAGTEFVFGYPEGGPAPFGVKYPETLFILAFQALPLVLVISALSAVFFYWKVLPKIVSGFSYILEKTMRLGGGRGSGCVGKYFCGNGGNASFNKALCGKAYPK
jgi:CNT family concentrative nucleoside transporter